MSSFSRISQMAIRLLQMLLFKPSSISHPPSRCSRLQDKDCFCIQPSTEIPQLRRSLHENCAALHHYSCLISIVVISQPILHQVLHNFIAQKNVACTQTQRKLEIIYLIVEAFSVTLLCIDLTDLLSLSTDFSYTDQAHSKTART